MGIGLFPYQHRGVEFLANRRYALLADDMGLGKTPQAIVAAGIVGAARILVICPAILCKTWAIEFNRWRVGNSLGIAIVQTGKDTVPANGIVIVSYDLATQPAIHAQLLSGWRDLLILDESHYLKDQDSHRTQAVFGVNLDGKGGVAGRAHRVWCLTGTPLPNHQAELYPMLRFFGTWKHGYGQMLSEFTIYSSHHRYGVRVKGVKNADVYRRMVKPVMLRRLKKEVAQFLPPIVVTEMPVEPAECDDTQQFLRQLRDEEPHAADKIRAAIEADDWSFEHEEHIARLRRLVGLAKVVGLCQRIEHDLASGMDKVVVFGMHKQFLEYAQRRLDCGLIYGPTPDAKRQELIEDFQGSKRARVLLAQIKTAGTGLTLTAAHNVIIAEPSWTPAENAQAMMRVHRIGQKRPVMARFATLTGSIDEAVTAVLRRKTAAITAYLG